jgi:hypothetical protein
VHYFWATIDLLNLHNQADYLQGTSSKQAYFRKTTLNFEC